MRIIIHRGTHQIGGCVTEIRTDNARIFIDMGSELPDADGKIPEETLTVEGVTQGDMNCDGVFFTHYHGDYIGMLSRILPDTPLYMGQAAKEVHLALQKRINPDLAPAIEQIRPFQAGEKIIISDISIIMVDHSAYDSYIF